MMEKATPAQRRCLKYLIDDPDGVGVTVTGYYRDTQPESRNLMIHATGMFYALREKGFIEGRRSHEKVTDAGRKATY